MFALLLLFACADTASPGDGGVVAHLGGNTVRYVDIRCDELQASFSGRMRSDVPVEDVCHEIEQRRLEQKIREILRPLAATKLDIRVADDEVAQWLRSLGLNEAGLARKSREAAILPTAALHVLEGTPASLVWEQELSPSAMRSAGLNEMPISQAEFAGWMKLLGNRETIDKMLRDSTVEATRTRFMNLAKVETLNTKIAVAITAAAADRAVSRESFSYQFWSSLAREAGLEIVDPRFRLPDFRRFL
jgi:hypothetical protein